MTEEKSQVATVANWSKRERDVLRHALTGMTSKEVAYELRIADSTVRVLLARAAARCGARTRRELLEKAAAGSP